MFSWLRLFTIFLIMRSPLPDGKIATLYNYWLHGITFSILLTVTLCVLYLWYIFNNVYLIKKNTDESFLQSSLTIFVFTWTVWYIYIKMQILLGLSLSFDYLSNLFFGTLFPFSAFFLVSMAEAIVHDDFLYIITRFLAVCILVL